MEFVILGPTALRLAGRGVQLGTAKQRGMLAILLYYVRQPVRIDVIVDHLWGEQPPGDHRPSLYALASRARSALSIAGLDDALVRVPGSAAYRLDIHPEVVDFHRFRRMLRDAHELTLGRDHDAAVAV